MSANGVELVPEQALAQRWLRERFAPLEVWQWLAGLPHVDIPAGLPLNGRLKLLLAELGAPLAEQSHHDERKSLDHALTLAASLLTFVHGKTRAASAACQHRMLAGCVLPLYRGLAQGSVQEVISVIRWQLTDSLALAALVGELDPVADLLACGMSRGEMPQDVLKSSLGINLDQLAERLLVCGYGWSGHDEGELRRLIASDVQHDARPSWGTAKVLWQLAGELTAERAEFIVPRDWIRIPVPWNEASEHWREIARALEASTAAATSDHTSGAHGAPTHVSGPESSQDDVARLKLEIEIADSIDSLVQESRSALRARSDNPFAKLRAQLLLDDFIVPKIMIAEVRSHNDPAFIAVVRRQLASCRNLGSTLSLVALRVQNEGEAEEHGTPTLTALGLSAWQQKLVNWMADHPDVCEPYAFVCSSGELILCLMDMERNAATSLLRQGLQQVLTGKRDGDDFSSSLARAHIPAKYHSGIGSVSSPAASLEAEQLIEATYRCLAAAERHGKAAIKSIEVF